jgi:hypothetical protein
MAHMMTFYEELGVPAEASREEIRQAYKRLVRLLHPDRCGDPATRVLAELQMRRLNGILEVLSRPDERANYDRSLMQGDAIRQCPTAAHDAHAQRDPPDWDGLWCDARWRRTVAVGALRAPPAYWEIAKAYANERARQAGPLMGGPPQRSIGGNALAWWHDARWRRGAMLPSAAALAAVVGLLLFCALMPSKPPVPKPVTPATAEPLPLGTPNAALSPRTPSPPVAAIQQEDASTETLAWDSPTAEERGVEAPSPASPEPAAIRDTMSVPAETARNSPPGERPHVLSGDWVFVPAAGTTRSGYPPEFIELRLREREGTMRGSYRARYRVTDRAISPNVAFQFEGRAAAEGGVLPWRGAGGSQGAVTLRLLANGNLQVEWEADRLGRELGLISGAATLVRKLE